MLVFFTIFSTKKFVVWEDCQYSWGILNDGHGIHKWSCDASIMVSPYDFCDVVATTTHKVS